MPSLLGLSLRKKKRTITYSHDNVVRLCKLALRDGFTIGQESVLFPLDYTPSDRDKIVEEWIKDNLNTN